jgi:FtsH-binding integral membrane protein
MPELEIQKYKYLRKSIRIYKVYGYSLLIALFTIIILKPLIKESYFLLDFMIGFPIIIMLFGAPLGLFYSFKSYSKKEDNPQKRLTYFMGHLFFTLLAFFVIFISLKDFSHLFF